MNSSRTLYQGFVMRGMSKEDAFFAVIDHMNELHWNDRNVYHARIKALESEIHRLKTKGNAE